MGASVSEVRLSASLHRLAERWCTYTTPRLRRRARQKGPCGEGRLRWRGRCVVLGPEERSLCVARSVLTPPKAGHEQHDKGEDLETAGEHAEDEDQFVHGGKVREVVERADRAEPGPDVSDRGERCG